MLSLTSGTPLRSWRASSAEAIAHRLGDLATGACRYRSRRSCTAAGNGWGSALNASAVVVEGVHLLIPSRIRAGVRVVLHARRELQTG